MKGQKLCQRVIDGGFGALLFLVPLVWTPYTRELFEFPKMILVYILTIVIAAAFLIKAVLASRLEIKRTPLDRPIGLFLVCYLLSTFFSINRYTSIFGYYTRFHGGLLSLLSYLLLYFILFGNLQFTAYELRVRKIRRLLFCLLASSFLVSVYAVLQHLGIDKDYWVQDVQARVFSTLGQPNWLAAYSVMILPVILGFALQRHPKTESAQPAKLKVQSAKLSCKTKLQNLNLTYAFYLTLFTIAYTAFWFTYSLSGLLGLAAAFLTLFLLTPKGILRAKAVPLSLLLAVCVLISLSSPGIFGPRLKSLWRSLTFGSVAYAQTKNGPSTVTGSTVNIRLIVWKGALNLIADHPLLGTGPETFAYAFLPYRPAAINKTDEWDFLYNKPHNEYLDTTANLGLLGLGAYIFLILRFATWGVKSFKTLKADALGIGLLSGWAGLLVTNFFGFSVVATGLLFWLYPALAFSLEDKR